MLVLSSLILAATAAAADPRPAPSPSSNATISGNDAVFLAPESSDAPMGWLGASLGAAPRPKEGEDSVSGVLVEQIIEGSPAEKAGLRGRDLVRAVDGVAVTNPSQLIDRIKKLPPGSWISLDVLRRRTARQIDVRLSERPADGASMRLVRGWIGAKAIEIPKTLRAHFGAPEDAGVLVSEVADGSPAEAGGLRVGDVLYEVDGDPVRSVGELYALISRSGVDGPVELSVARDGARLTLEPLVAKAPAKDTP